MSYRFPIIAISVAAISMLQVSCGGEDNDAAQTPGATGDMAGITTKTDRAGTRENVAPPTDPFAGVAPEALADSIAQRLGLTPQETVAALEAVATPPDVGADIRGVRLGMTPEQAIAALKTSFPQDAIIEEPRYFTVPQSAGLWPPGQEATVATPGAYADKARATDNKTKDIINVEFALPPADNVVHSITRIHNMRFSESGKKVSAGVYHQVLIDKYGPPDAEFDLYSGKVLKWLYPSSGVDCASGARGATHGQSWVLQYAGNPTDCATALIYSYAAGNDGIVQSVGGKIANPGHLHINKMANMALREEVRKKDAEARREQATDIPDI